MSNAFGQMSRSRVLAAYLGDIRFELIKMFRTPAFAIPTLLFPVLFFILFGVLMGSARGNMEMSKFAFAAYGVFGTIAPGLFGFGVSLAFEREQGLLLFRQAIPMPPASVLLARMVMAMIFVAISSLLMLILAVFVARVPLTFTQVITVFFVNVIGVLPFCAMGLYVGSLVSGQAAPAIVNLIYLPMSFLSGLWVPLQFLPKILQQLAPIWPAHHLAQLSMNAVDVPSVGSTANHVGALVGVTIFFFGLAVRRLGGRGFRVFGASGNSFAFPLRRAVSVGLFWISVGLVIAGIAGGNAPRAVARTAATSTDATEQGSTSAATDAGSAVPVGVAAPATSLISDFESGEAASYGLGWRATDDRMRGGNSSVSQKRVDGGAANSRAALEVTGEVGSAIQYPFVGTSFLPNGNVETDFAQQGLMDFSGKRNLRFFVRGDGGYYTVVILGPVMGGMPAMYGFNAGADWQEVNIPLHELVNIDLRRVKVISIGSGTPGAFRFQIDDVRVE